MLPDLRPLRAVRRKGATDLKAVDILLEITDNMTPTERERW